MTTLQAARSVVALVSCTLPQQLTSIALSKDRRAFEGECKQSQPVEQAMPSSTTSVTTDSSRRLSLSRCPAGVAVIGHLSEEFVTELKHIATSHSLEVIHFSPAELDSSAHPFAWPRRSGKDVVIDAVLACSTPTKADERVFDLLSASSDAPPALDSVVGVNNSDEDIMSNLIENLASGNLPIKQVEIFEELNGTTLDYYVGQKFASLADEITRKRNQLQCATRPRSAGAVATRPPYGLNGNIYSASAARNRKRPGLSILVTRPSTATGLFTPPDSGVSLRSTPDMSAAGTSSVASSFRRTDHFVKQTPRPPQAPATPWSAKSMGNFSSWQKLLDRSLTNAAHLVDGRRILHPEAETFLLFYRKWCLPEELLIEIERRFVPEIASQDAAMALLSSGRGTRLGELLVEWVRRHPEDFSDRRVYYRLRRLGDLLNATVCFAGFGWELSTLLPLIAFSDKELDLGWAKCDLSRRSETFAAIFDRCSSSRQQGKDGIHTSFGAHSAPRAEMLVDGVRPTFEHYERHIAACLLHNAAGIAEALHKVTVGRFDALTKRDLIRYIWTNSKLREALLPDGPVTRCIALNNKIANWAAVMVLAGGKVLARSRMLETLIEACVLLYEWKSFDALVALVVGLQHSSLARLYQTWRTISPAHLVDFQGLSHIMGPHQNWVSYRKAYAGVLDDLETPPPRRIVATLPAGNLPTSPIDRKIPYLGVVLQDLVQASEGNKATVSIPPTPGLPEQINWRRYEMLADILKSVVPERERDVETLTNRVRESTTAASEAGSVSDRHSSRKVSGKLARVAGTSSSPPTVRNSSVRSPPSVARNSSCGTSSRSSFSAGGEFLFSLEPVRDRNDTLKLESYQVVATESLYLLAAAHGETNITPSVRSTASTAFLTRRSNTGSSSSVGVQTNTLMEPATLPSSASKLSHRSSMQLPNKVDMASVRPWAPDRESVMVSKQSPVFETNEASSTCDSAASDVSELNTATLTSPTTEPEPQSAVTPSSRSAMSALRASIKPLELASWKIIGNCDSPHTKSSFRSSILPSRKRSSSFRQNYLHPHAAIATADTSGSKTPHASPGTPSNARPRRGSTSAGDEIIDRLFPTTRQAPSSANAGKMTIDDPASASISQAAHEADHDDDRDDDCEARDMVSEIVESTNRRATPLPPPSASSRRGTAASSSAMTTGDTVRSRQSVAAGKRTTRLDLKLHSIHRVKQWVSSKRRTRQHGLVSQP